MALVYTGCSPMYSRTRFNPQDASSLYHLDFIVTYLIFSMRQQPMSVPQALICEKIRHYPRVLVAFHEVILSIALHDVVPLPTKWLL
jgi:hypothetical protein